MCAWKYVANTTYSEVKAISRTIQTQSAAFGTFTATPTSSTPTYTSVDNYKMEQNYKRIQNDNNNNINSVIFYILDTSN